MIETVFFEVLLFMLLLLPLGNAAHVGVVIELLQLGSRNWIHLYRFVQAALLRQSVELLVQTTHIVCVLARFSSLGEGLNDIIMIGISAATRARPSAGEPRALVTI